MLGSTPRLAIAVTVGLLLATAIVLTIARGPALLVDMSALIGMLCL